MIKPFNELSQVEVPTTPKPIFKYNKKTQSLEETGKLDTITWVTCLQKLYENGAEKVTYENVPNPQTGGLLYHDENGCMHILVYVDIDGDRREIFYPLIDGTSVVKADKVTHSDIYNAKQRAFVKCVALNWGLGINVWKKADAEAKVEKEEQPKSVQKDLRNIVNTATKKFGSIPKMLEFIPGYTEKSVKVLIEESGKIDEITKKLEEALNDNKSGSE